MWREKWLSYKIKNGFLNSDKWLNYPVGTSIESQKPGVLGKTQVDGHVDVRTKGTDVCVSCYAHQKIGTPGESPENQVSAMIHPGHDNQPMSPDTPCLDKGTPVGMATVTGMQDMQRGPWRAFWLDLMRRLLLLYPQTASGKDGRQILNTAFSLGSSCHLVARYVGANDWQGSNLSLLKEQVEI